MKSLQRMRFGVVFALLALPAASFGQDDQSAGGPNTGAPAISAPQAGEQPNTRTATRQAADDRLTALEQQLRELRQSNELLGQEVDTLRDEVRRLNDRLGELATSGGSLPRNLLGQMATDDEFRREVMRAVQGEVVIDNRTTSTECYYINGVHWSVPPGKYVVWVPFGEVTANLRDEQPRDYSDHWQLVRDRQTGEPRHYRLRLSIGYPPAGPVVESGVIARR